jgi:hypothetical protein
MSSAIRWDEPATLSTLVVVAGGPPIKRAYLSAELNYLVEMAIRNSTYKTRQVLISTETGVDYDNDAILELAGRADRPPLPGT